MLRPVVLIWYISVLCSTIKIMMTAVSRWAGVRDQWSLSASVRFLQPMDLDQGLQDQSVQAVLVSTSLWRFVAFDLTLIITLWFWRPSSLIFRPCRFWWQFFFEANLSLFSSKFRFHPTSWRWWLQLLLTRPLYYRGDSPFISPANLFFGRKLWHWENTRVQMSGSSNFVKAVWQLARMCSVRSLWQRHLRESGKIIFTIRWSPNF